MNLYLNKKAAFENDKEIHRNLFVDLREREGFVVGKIQLRKPPILTEWLRNNPEPPLWGNNFVERLDQVSAAYEERKRSESGSSYHLCIHLIGEYNAEARGNWGNTVKVKVHGFLGDMLQNLDFRYFKLKLQMGLHSHNLTTLEPQHSTLLFAEFPVSSNGALGPHAGGAQCDQCVSSGGDHQCNAQCFCGCMLGEMFFEGTISDADFVGNLLQSHGSAAIRGDINVILTAEGPNPIYSNVILISSNGTEFDCNKIILTANSTVFAEMFERQPRGADDNLLRIEMGDDIGQAGIRALLAYLYTRAVEDPNQYSKIALELLVAANKYDIRPLKVEMEQLFISKPVEWYSMEVALGLFIFAAGLEGGEDDELELQRNAVHKLRLKSRSMTLEAFSGMVRGNAEFSPFLVEILQAIFME